MSRQASDIFLNTGEFYFGSSAVRIRTLLGSCVSIIMWHRQRRIGGMCHYMLPQRRSMESRYLDGRYADDAVQLFMDEIAAAGSLAHEYEVSVIGGGRMFKSDMNIGGRNIEAARRLLLQYGFNIQREHLAGTGHRKVVFDLGTGEIRLNHVQQTMQIVKAT